MMCRVKYERKEYIDIMRVRQMCINNNFYTKGDCKAYDSMFEMCREYNLTQNQNDLISIAGDIYEHSDSEEFEDYGFETVYECIAWIQQLLIGCMNTSVTAIEYEEE